MVTCGGEGTATTNCATSSKKIETENCDTGQVVITSLHFNLGVVLSSLFSLLIMGDSALKAFLTNKRYKVFHHSVQLPDNREETFQSIRVFFFQQEHESSS